LLFGLTQAAAQIINPERLVNPLCNWFFTGASTLVIVGLGWFLTDRVIEPRLCGTEVDGDPADLPRMENRIRELNLSGCSLTSDFRRPTSDTVSSP
jgi:aminobenzoyl-glutamate transport protein